MRKTARWVLWLLAAGLIGGAARAEEAHAPTGGSILQSGARCDGSTDDAPAIDAWLAKMHAGGRVQVPPGRFCLIGSADLTVPANVIIEGEAVAIPHRNGRRTGSGFLVDPAHSIVMKGSSALRDIAVWRAGLQQDPTDAQAIAAVAAWGKEDSRGITIAGGGVRLTHLFIEGFNTAIYGFGWGSFIISDVIGDDYNGIFITGAGDNAAILDARFEPFYAIASRRATVGAHGALESAQGATLRLPPGVAKAVQPGDFAAVLSGPHAGAIPTGTTVTSVDAAAGTVVLSQAPLAHLAPGDPINFGGAWARPGVAFYLQGDNGNTTGWYCRRCFSFMYRHGAVIDGTGVGSMAEADFEYQHAFDPGTDGHGSFGIRLAGGSAGVSIVHSGVGGEAIGLQDDMAPPHQVTMTDVGFGTPDFIITNAASGPAAVAGGWFSGESGVPVVLRADGPAPAGVTQGLRIGNARFAVTPRPGEGRRQVLSAWGRAVNSDPALAAAHVVAFWAGDTLTLFAPPGMTLDVSAQTSGGLSIMRQAGRPNPGAWAMVNGFAGSGGPGHPAVVVGPRDGLPVVFTNFMGDNNGHVTPGYFAIDPSSTKVQFLSWPAGTTGEQRLAGCGRGAALAPGSTALRGMITEGAGAAGCVLHFPVPFPRPPFCTVSSPSGAALSGYAATAEALTIRNPPSDGKGGGRFTYICAP